MSHSAARRPFVACHDSPSECTTLCVRNASVNCRLQWGRAQGDSLDVGYGKATDLGVSRDLTVQGVTTLDQTFAGAISSRIVPNSLVESKDAVVVSSRISGNAVLADIEVGEDGAAKVKLTFANVVPSAHCISNPQFMGMQVTTDASDIADESFLLSSADLKNFNGATSQVTVIKANGQPFASGDKFSVAVSLQYGF
jgi:hypothetical protein